MRNRTYQFNTLLTTTLLAAGLAGVLLVTATAVHSSRFTRGQSSKLKIRSEVALSSADESQIADAYLLLKNEVQDVLKISTEFGSDIRLFANEDSYREYFTKHHAELSYRPALYIQQNGASYLVLHQNQNLIRDLRHEGTHAILHQSLRRPLPLWCDEGLAEYFEQLEGPALQQQVNDNRKNNDHWNEHWEILRSQLKQGWKPDLQKLEQLREITEMTPVNYCECWAWLHFLIHHDEKSTQLLREFLVEFQNGAADDRLSKKMREAYFSPEEELLQHLQSLGLNEAAEKTDWFSVSSPSK